MTRFACTTVLTLFALCACKKDTSSEDSARDRRNAETLVTRTLDAIQQQQQIGSRELSSKAERLASRVELVAALHSSSSAEQAMQAQLAFQKFLADAGTGEARPDVIALVDLHGDLRAMHDVPMVVPKQWRSDPATPMSPTILPGLNAALATKLIVSDSWSDKFGMTVGVASVIDPEAAAAGKPEIIGAIVIGYALTARQAQRARAQHGTEVAYHDGQRVLASSFTRGQGTDEDTAKTGQLDVLLSDRGLFEKSPKVVTVGGIDYFAAAVALPRSASSPLPDGYPKVTFGTIVLAPIVKLGSAAAEVRVPMGSTQAVSRTANSANEVAAFLSELRLREEQYRLENGSYLAAPACPAFPSTTLKDVTPCLADGMPWKALGVQAPSSAVSCSYAITVGNGDGTRNPNGFTFTSPAAAWYYILATCNTPRGVSTYFTSSVDTTIQKQAQTAAP